METFYYGDPRNEIEKSQKKITRLTSLVITLLVMVICTTTVYLVIDKRSTKLSKNIVIVGEKVDTTNQILMSHTIQLSDIQLKQNETDAKVDTLISNLGYLSYTSGKGTKTINKIDKKVDTLILLVNK
jgi:hypothetical protein